MRTTVTLDADTEALLREEVRRTGRSFKEVLNAAVQRALGSPKARSIEVRPLFHCPFPAEFEAVSMNRMADQLDDEETLAELGEWSSRT